MLRTPAPLKGALGTRMNLNPSEQEVVNLCICYEAAYDIANYQLFSVRPISDDAGGCQVDFMSSLARELFLIRLLDFAKEGGSSDLTGSSGSCLYVLTGLAANPQLGVGEGLEALKGATRALTSWLEQSPRVSMWLPTLDIDAKISVPRKLLLEIAANQSKHNIARLTGVAGKIYKALVEHGYPVSPERIPLALEDIREHLQGNLFAYYGTWLAQLVNDICWAIFDYLRPTFLNSYCAPATGEIAYKYAYPSEIRHEAAREWFWRLMNDVRSNPPHNRFKANRYLAARSSLEDGSGAGA